MPKNADSVYQQIVGFARDPRCDHLMAVGLAMALMEKLGKNGLALINRDRFLGADPAHSEDTHWDIVEHSMIDGWFISDQFFAAAQQLSTPVAAAATMTVLYSDLLADGETEAASALSNEVRERLRRHMRQM
jgi:hypothetical protein